MPSCYVKLPVKPEQQITVPMGAAFLLAEADGDEIVLWMLASIPALAALEKRTAAMECTIVMWDDPPKLNGSHEYIGTARTRKGPVRVFERR